MTTKTELSPAAKAVLDAANGCSIFGPKDCLNESRKISAALRAAVAATQMRKYVDGSFGLIEAIGLICEADELLAIADELEAHSFKK